MRVVPAILTDDPQKLEELLIETEKSGRFERVQIDFVDGEYTTNKSVGVEDLPASRQGVRGWGLKLDAHLMVIQKNVQSYFEAAKQAGFERIIVQMESVSRPEDYTALALDIHSPVEAIEPYIEKLEYVVVMGIEPGFGGQKFDPKTMEKIKRLDSLREQSKFKFRICVDGGVQKEHLADLEKAGADEAAVGGKRVLGW